MPVGGGTTDSRFVTRGVVITLSQRVMGGV